MLAALHGLSERLKAKFVTPGDIPRYEASLTSTRAALGEVEWERAWSRGRAMSVAETIQFALGQN